MDCVIIGGGPAGLTAAIYLARFNREAIVIDGGDSRARLIPTSHNYPGFAEGVGGPKLLDLLSRQAEHYGIRRAAGQVQQLERTQRGFTVNWKGGQLTAARAILATGLIDKRPPIERLGKAIAEGLVRYCPVCDGFEASDQRIAVLGHAKEACAKALFLRTYSSEVTLLTLDESRPDESDCAELDKAGIKRPATGVVSIDHGVGIVTTHLTNGERLTFDTLYPVLGCEVRSQLATSLGAAENDVGCLIVDSHQQTTISGLYAIGDVVSDLHQIAVATGHAAIAATRIHHELPRNLKTLRIFDTPATSPR